VSHFTIPINLPGQLALTAYTRFGAGSMPVRTQLEGRPFGDATVLRAG